MEFPARREIARPARNKTDEIVGFAEHFAEMRSRAGADVRHDVGARVPVGLIVASNRGQRAESLAVEIVENVLEILPHAAVQRGINIGRGGAAWHRRSGEVILVARRLEVQ